MSENQAYPVATLCRVLGVSSSGYYAWSKRSPSRRARDDAVLIERIGAIHAASKGTYGAPRIHAELRATGRAVGKKRVARLMRHTDLAGVSRRRFVTTTVRNGDQRAPDLVDRDFTAEGPKSAVGGRYHFRADVDRLPLPGGHTRCVQPPRRRLGDGHDLAQPAGS